MSYNNYLDSKESLINFVKYHTEEPNIDIVTNKNVYSVNFYDPMLEQKVGEIYNKCQETNQLILGVQTYD